MALEPMAIGVMLGVGESPEESLQKVLDVGVTSAQMGRPPDAWLKPAKAAALKKMVKKSGITLTTVFCGFDGESYADIPTVRATVGLVPKATRAARVKKAKQIADFAKILGVRNVAAHIGFVPEDPRERDYKDIVRTVGQFADYLKKNGQRLCLETGQETGECLLRFIKDTKRSNVKVNFDPANMILYGSGEPIPALKLVGKHVAGVHCKDGIWPTEKDKLGTEVPLGKGKVNIPRFIQTLADLGYKGPLTIEREITGDQQKKDIVKARKLLERIRAKVLAKA
ncbi:MAG TPA: sugar phosphate isomerase/epimerase family protein [Planctomycetota bacterium]|nr:sugar phosphate isomerase/epimerase family protein [Planctomycetota bacterium]